MPKLVYERPPSPNCYPLEPKITRVWRQNRATMEELAQRRSPRELDVLRQRVRDKKQPDTLRLLYAGLLARSGDSVGQTFLIQRAQAARTMDEVRDSFWVFGSLNYFRADHEDHPADMKWAKDFLISAIQNTNVLYYDLFSDLAAPTVIEKHLEPYIIRELAMDMFIGRFCRLLGDIQEPGVLEILTDTYRATRDDECLLGLAALNDRRADPFFLEVLRNQEEPWESGFFVVAADALAKSGNKDALPILLDHLDEMQVYTALRYYQDDRILPAIKKALPKLESYSKGEAQLLIIHLEGGDRFVRLEALARKPDFQSRHHDPLREILALKDERSIPLAVEILQSSPDLNQRATAIDILGTFNQPAALKALILGLDLDYKSLNGGNKIPLDMVNREYQKRITDQLRRLSGKDFGVDSAAWSRWFENAYQEH